MHTKLLNPDRPVTYAVVLDTGDEVAAELGRFVRENEVEAASITAIGAFRGALLGYFDWPSLLPSYTTPTTPLMIYGHARIPITSWLRDNATESLAHAQEAGQMIMRLHRRPALGIAALPTTQHNTIDEILAESIQREEAGASSRFRALNSISEIAGDSVRTSDAKPGAAGICVEFVACPSLPLPNSVTSTFDIEEGRVPSLVRYLHRERSRHSLPEPRHSAARRERPRSLALAEDSKSKLYRDRH